MQLSTSTFPLDPSLAAAPAVSSTAVAPGLGTATDGDTPAFSTLLSSESTAAAETADPAPGLSLFSVPTALTEDSLADGETEPTAETAEAVIAAWLSANGFPPPAAPVVTAAPELPGVEALVRPQDRVDVTVPAAAEVPGDPVGGTTISSRENAPRGVPRSISGSADAEPGFTEQRGMMVSTRALREVVEPAPDAFPVSDAPAVAIVEAPVETAAPSVARSPRSGEAVIAAYQASAGPAAGDGPADKFRLRAKTPAAETALPRHDPFSFVGVDPAAPATVADARALVSPPAATRTESAPSVVAAAESEAMIEGVADTLAPANAPRADRGRPESRAVGSQSILPVPVATPDAAAAVRVSRGAEKFAVAAEKPADTTVGDSNAREKNSLTVGDKEVVVRSSGFGINAAKTETLMPATPTSAAPSTATAELERVLPVPATFETLFTESEQTTTTLVQAARRSVESALNVAEQFARGEKRGVTLQFSVSGVDLGVRVELRGDGVHTTFRTDSPELRAALAQEWQSVAAGQGSDRAARFVDPVFTAASPGNSQQGDASAGHRDSPPRQDRQLADDLAALQVAPRIKTQAAVSPASVALARGTSVSTSSRLHTFA